MIFSKTIITIQLFAALMLGTPQTMAQTGRAIGEYKGISPVSRTIRERILKDKNVNFSIGYFLSEKLDSSTFQLLQLLGSYSQLGSENRYKNGLPNAINSFLWSISMLKFSDSIGEVCETGSPIITAPISAKYELHPDIFSTLSNLCDLFAGNDGYREMLENLWFQTMGWDLPEEEMRTFIDFFDDESIVHENGASHISSLVSSLYLQPGFILNR